MSIRAFKHVFASERAPNGEAVKKIGLQLMALIAGYHLNETNTARVPLDHLCKFLNGPPAVAETYIENLVKAGLVEVVEVEPEGYVRLKICGLEPAGQHHPWPIAVIPDVATVVETALPLEEAPPVPAVAELVEEHAEDDGDQDGLDIAAEQALLDLKAAEQEPLPVEPDPVQPVMLD